MRLCRVGSRDPNIGSSFALFKSVHYRSLDQKWGSGTKTATQTEAGVACSPLMGSTATPITNALFYLPPNA